MRTPKPYFKKSHQCWYVNIHGKTTKLAKGKADAWQKYYEIMAARQEIRPDSTTVRALIGRFLQWNKNHRSEGTYQWYAGHLSSFGHYIGDKLKVGDLKPYHVTRWIEEKYKGTSDNYQHGAIRSIQRACNWAVKEGHLDRSPVSTLEKPTPTPRERLVTDEEWRQILDHTPDREFRDLLLILRLTGCRPQEARSVEARHVVKNGPPRFVFEINESKGKKRRRVVPLSKRAVEIVRRLMLTYPEGPLFRNTKGNPWTKNAVSCRFDRLQKKLGFRISLYNIRHTWVTRAIENGVDIATVAAIIGHKDATTLLKNYAHLVQNDDRLSDKMEQALGDDNAIFGGSEPSDGEEEGTEEAA